MWVEFSTFKQYYTNYAENREISKGEEFLQHPLQFEAQKYFVCDELNLDTLPILFKD